MTLGCNKLENVKLPTDAEVLESNIDSRDDSKIVSVENNLKGYTYDSKKFIIRDKQLGFKYEVILYRYNRYEET